MLAPLRPNGQAAGPANIGTGELLRAVDESVQVLSIPNLEMRFPLFVSGVDLRPSGADPEGLQTVLPDKLVSPKSRPTARHWRAFGSSPTRAPAATAGT